MPYRIKRRDKPAASLLRLLCADLEGVETDLAGSGPRAARIHSARQRLKRMRTILRVLKPAFPDHAVAARQALARAARLLARARDADVAAAGARVLAASTSHGDVGFGRIADALDAEAEQAHALRTPLRDVAVQIAAARVHIDALDTSFDGRALLQRALDRTYAKGRRTMRRAGDTLSTTDLHEWRKSVKAHWHLLRLLRKRLPRRVHRRAPDLKELGELLGLDHDHAALAEKLALSPEGDLALMKQLAVIAERRRALEAEAFAIGKRLYRRKPSAFAKRAVVA